MSKIMITVDRYRQIQKESQAYLEKCEFMCKKYDTHYMHIREHFMRTHHEIFQKVTDEVHKLVEDTKEQRKVTEHRIPAKIIEHPWYARLLWGKEKQELIPAQVIETTEVIPPTITTKSKFLMAVESISIPEVEATNTRFCIAELPRSAKLHYSDALVYNESLMTKAKERITSSRNFSDTIHALDRVFKVYWDVPMSGAMLRALQEFIEAKKDLENFRKYMSEFLQEVSEEDMHVCGVLVDLDKYTEISKLL